MTILFVITSPRLTPSPELKDAVKDALVGDSRLRELRIREIRGRRVLQVDLGGSVEPREGLNHVLLQIAREYLNEDASVRVTYRYEVLIEESVVEDAIEEDDDGDGAP